MEENNITSLRVENFRALKSAHLNGLEQLTILIGKNGAGKSSVLEALYLTSSFIDNKDAIRRIGKFDYAVNRRGGRGNWDGSRHILWFSMNTDEDILVELSTNNQTYSFMIPYRDSDVWLKIPDNVKSLLGSHYDRYDLLGRGSIVKSSETGELAHIPSNVYTRIREALRKELRSLESMIFIDHQLLSQPDKIEDFAWSKVLARRLDKEIVQMIREEFEVDAEGLTYMPIGGTNALALQLSKTAVRIDDLGDGARGAILASLILLATNPKTILIEEPEIHMHPTGLKVFTEFILKLARRKGSQIIASTHSIEFTAIASKLAEDLGINMSILFLERSPEGVVTYRRLSGVDADTLRKLGLDPRFLYVI